jgi:hypothetical protein
MTAGHQSWACNVSIPPPPIYLPEFSWEILCYRNVSVACNSLGGAQRQRLNGERGCLAAAGGRKQPPPVMVTEGIRLRRQNRSVDLQTRKRERPQRQALRAGGGMTTIQFPVCSSPKRSQLLPLKRMNCSLETCHGDVVDANHNEAGFARQTIVRAWLASPARRDVGGQRLSAPRSDRGGRSRRRDSRREDHGPLLWG